MKTILFLIFFVSCIFALDKYTVPFSASDTMTAAQFNSNHDTIKAYVDKIIDTINLNVPRYSQNTNTHDDTIPYINIDTLNVDTLSSVSIGAGTFSADSINIGATEWFTCDTGSFACTLMNVTTTVTGTATYKKYGKLAIVTFPAFTGTSNSTDFAIKGVPAILRPAERAISAPAFAFYDNSDNVYDAVTCTSDGTTTFTFWKSGNWTSSGTKGTSKAFDLLYIDSN